MNFRQMELKFSRLVYRGMYMDEKLAVTEPSIVVSTEVSVINKMALAIRSQELEDNGLRIFPHDDVEIAGRSICQECNELNRMALHLSSLHTQT